MKHASPAMIIRVLLASTRDENPHSIHESRLQLTIYVWAGINGDHVTGPYDLPLQLSNSYILTKELLQLLETAPTATRQKFIHVVLLPDLGCFPSSHCVDEKLMSRPQTRMWLGKTRVALTSQATPEFLPWIFPHHIACIRFRRCCGSCERSQSTVFLQWCGHKNAPLPLAGNNHCSASVAQALTVSPERFPATQWPGSRLQWVADVKAALAAFRPHYPDQSTWQGHVAWPGRLSGLTHAHCYQYNHLRFIQRINRPNTLGCQKRVHSSFPACAGTVTITRLSYASNPTDSILSNFCTHYVNTKRPSRSNMIHLATIRTPILRHSSNLMS
jgi:hypothetical protein